MSTTMDTSFSSRRQAATNLPQFHLPAPGDIPSMPKPPSSSTTSSAPSPLHSTSFPQPLPLALPGGGGGGGNSFSATSVLTPPLGVTSDALSPLSSANTAASSQTSGPSAGLSGYYGHSHGSWPTPASGSGSYTFSSANQQQVPPLGQSAYGGRNVYGQSASISYGSRNPQSPPTGPEGLPPPSYDQAQQSYSTGMPGSAGTGGSGSLGSSGGLGISSGTAGGGGSGSGSGLLGSLGSGPSGSGPSTLSTQSQQGQPPMLSSQNSNPQSSSNTASGHGHGQVDAYPHSRTPPSQSYYAPVSSSHASSFQSYAPSHQASHSHPAPTTSTGPARTLSSMVPPSGMAAPQPYRTYSYHHMSHLGGPIMSNMGNPGGQMSLVPGMGVHAGYGQMPQRMYSAPGHQTQQERPFKCDQCTQSFNRNHDLKRHKRIHLAVKPFPCPSCDKSFSRKDALKRHRLVRNCGEADKQDASKSTRRERNEATGRPQGNDPNMDLPVKMEGHHRDTVTRR